MFDRDLSSAWIPTVKIEIFLPSLMYWEEVVITQILKLVDSQHALIYQESRISV